MSVNLKQIQQLQNTVANAYLAKCKAIRPQIIEFRKSSRQSPYYFKPDADTALLDLNRNLTDPKLNERGVRKNIDAVSCWLYSHPYKQSDKFLYQAFRYGRLAAHRKFKEMGSSLNLTGGMAPSDARKTTALGTFLIDLTTIRNLYQVIKFLDSETAIAVMHLKHKSEQVHSIAAEHAFTHETASEPSLYKLYNETLKKRLKKLHLTYKTASAMPDFVKYLINITIAMSICSYITFGKHNQKLFNLSSAECLHLPGTK